MSGITDGPQSRPPRTGHRRDETKIIRFLSQLFYRIVVRRKPENGFQPFGRKLGFARYGENTTRQDAGSTDPASQCQPSHSWELDQTVFDSNVSASCRASMAPL